MSEDQHPPDSRMIDAGDEAELRRVAEELRCRPEAVAEAIQKVRPIRTAVELYLTAPRT